MRLERNNDAIGGEWPAASNVSVANRHRRVLLVFALGGSLQVGACGGGAAVPVDQTPEATAAIAAVTTPAATTVADDAGSIPTIDFTERMPTMPPIPTQDMGPSPVELVRSFAVGSPNLSGMRVDREGNVYVGSRFENQILKYDEHGEFLLTWSVPDAQPEQIGVMGMDARGDVYVAATDNYIRKFDPSGKLLSKWGGTGTGPGKFNGPGHMAFDRQGNYYVGDRDNQRVQKFDRDGKFLLQWGGARSDDGQFAVVGGLAMDQLGNVYVSDYFEATVQKFDSNGKFLLKWGTTGTEPGQFNNQWVTAVDQRGVVYVADTENRRVQTFDSNGKYLAQWNSSGEEPLVYPEAVAIDTRGYIYVSEDSHDRGSRIHIYRPRA